MSQSGLHAAAIQYDPGVYCHFENDRFPAGEFIFDTEGRRIHQRNPLHTIAGILVNPSRRPLPPAEAPPLLPE